MIVTMEKLNLFDFRINSLMTQKKDILGDLPDEFKLTKNQKNETEE